MDELFDLVPVVVVTTPGGSKLVARVLIHLRQAARDTWSVCIEPADLATINAAPSGRYTFSSWDGFWGSVGDIRGLDDRQLGPEDLPIYVGRAKPTPDGWGSGVLHSDASECPFSFPSLPERWGG